MNSAPLLPAMRNTFATREPVFHPIADRLLHLDHPDRTAWLADVCSGLDAFPEIAARDRRALLRGIAMHDAAGRIVFRIQSQFPRVASFVARCLAITGERAAARAIAQSRPIILGLMHFGPIYFNFEIVRRLFGARTIYALHAGGSTGAAVARYLRRVGIVPMVNDERSLRTLATILAKDPNCVIVMTPDYLGRPSRVRVPFLGRSIHASRGLAHLAERYGAVVVTAWGELGPFGPHVRVDDVFEIDPSLPTSNDRQRALIERTFRALESQVRKSPQAWSEWRNAGRFASP